MNIINNDTTQVGKTFEDVYQETLQEFLEVVREGATVKGKCKRRRDLMQIVMYVFICRHLRAHF
jgi:hypothetical protein